MLLWSASVVASMQVSRRAIVWSSVAMPASAALDSFPRVDEGKNEQNVLTSKVLEKIRVQRQLEADERYDELADPNQQSSSASRLAKVLAMAATFDSFRQDIEQGDAAKWSKVSAALAADPFEKAAFKRAFNAYSDNIFYSDPDRANLYLLGGTPPSTKQTIQYLHRNDALDNLELLRSELDYLVAETTKGPQGDTDVADALTFHRKTVAAFDAYFALAPDADRTAASLLLKADRR